MSEEERLPETLEELAYRDWGPNEKIASPASGRKTLSVRNKSGDSGKYSLKIGKASNQHFAIKTGKTDTHDVTNVSFVGTNDGKVVLAWNRS
jgi:hypothetical protein